MIVLGHLKKIVFSLCFLSMSVYAKVDASVTDFNNTYKQYSKYADQNDWERALPYAEKAYELGKQVYEPDNKNVAALAYNYGLVLKHTGDYKQATKITFEALALYETVFGKKSYELIPVLLDLGRLKARTFEPGYQLRYLRRAEKISKEYYGKESAEHGQLLVNIGASVMNESQTRNAIRYLNKGHSILLDTLGSNNIQTGIAAFHLGKYYMAIYDYKKAKEHLLNAMKTFERPDQPSNRLELMTHGFLTEAYEQLDERDAATKHCLAIGRMTPFTSKQNYFPLVKRAPKYPFSAAAQEKEGFVIVEFDVDKSGFVQNPKVVERKGASSFEKAALKAVDKFRYAPAFENGEPVAVSGVRNKITFEMADL